MQHLPTHPRTGAAAIGWRDARPGEHGPQPIWHLRGASGEADDAEQDDDEADAGDDDGQDGGADGEDALGDAGKRALAQLREQVKTEKRARRDAEAKLAAATTASQETKTGDQPDIEQLRTQALAQARSETLRERALDRLEARAGRRLQDPADARAHLAASVEDFIDGDKLDTAAMDEAIEDLLKTKPYLAATAAGGRPHFAGTGDGGARRGSSSTSQVTEEQLKKMTPAEIDKAHRDGRLDELLGKKN